MTFPGPTPTPIPGPTTQVHQPHAYSEQYWLLSLQASPPALIHLMPRPSWPSSQGVSAVPIDVATSSATAGTGKGEPVLREQRALSIAMACQASPSSSALFQLQEPREARWS